MSITDLHQADVGDPWASAAPQHLSPSAAADFMQCPRLYRYKKIDRLPDPPTLAAARGTLVHQVLQDLFDAPTSSRTLSRAQAAVPTAWARVCEQNPEYRERFPTWGVSDADLYQQANRLLAVYFTMEDPTLYPSTTQESQVNNAPGVVPMLGYIDRIDFTPQGDERITDYKTGRAPHPRFRDKALWQLRFYALARRAETGRLPKQLRLLYLGDGGDTITHTPTDAEIDQFQLDLDDLWRTIMRAYDTGVFTPTPSKLCDWCPFTSICPAYPDR